MSINKFNMFASWISLFSTMWLILLRMIPTDILTWTFFALFAAIALFSAASHIVETRPPK